VEAVDVDVDEEYVNHPVMMHRSVEITRTRKQDTKIHLKSIQIHHKEEQDNQIQNNEEPDKNTRRRRKNKAYA